MNKLELIQMLSLMDEEDIYIEIDEVQYDIGITQREETFDGFDTVYPASISLIPNMEE